MNRYQPPGSRAAFALAATAMTAITLCLLVVVPATIEPGAPRTVMLTANDAFLSTGASPASGRQCTDPIGTLQAVAEERG